MNRFAKAALAAAAPLAAAPFHALRAQCAMCQATLASSGDAGRLASAFQLGIGLMFAVMAGLAFIGWRIARRARARFQISKSQQCNAVSATNSCAPAETSVCR